ncbi:MAG: hypothetical protein M1283_05945 [Gammaproteobacteria bacterium]|nr:hypothetical protein [Gammaproteobacteria bacterium]
MTIVRKMFRVEGMHCGACAVSTGMMLKAVQGRKILDTPPAKDSVAVAAVVVLVAR